MYVLVEQFKLAYTVLKQNNRYNNNDVSVFQAL